MGIKRYFSNADNTITNAFKSNLSVRGTGSNMGQADVLEVFSLYGQATTSSAEMSRVLINFPVSEVSTDRTNEVIPQFGKVNFFLKLYNCEHPYTLPRNYTLSVHAINSAWEEGNGLDMDNYTDITRNKIGSNWVKRAGATAWSLAGGDFASDTSSSFNQSFTIGDEDLEIDVTTLVEQWINSTGNTYGSKSTNGFLVKLSSSYEATSSSNLTGAAQSYYTKKFFGRGSEYFFKRPTLEARWDSATKDNRANFYFSSSLAPAVENLNTIYFYNYVRGRLKDIPAVGTGNIYVSVYSGSSDDSELSGSALHLSVDGTHVANSSIQAVTGGRASRGIYSASFAFTGSDNLETIYDVWFTGGSTIPNASRAAKNYHSGTISPYKFNASNINPNGNYVVSMPNLKQTYTNFETERFRLFVRNKNWSPTIYNKASKDTPKSLIIESASFQVIRSVDSKVVISYGTGSSDNNCTMLSYDVSGNYFDLDMSMLDPGYSYAFQYSFYEDSVSSYREQPYIFKFRVNRNEY